MTALAIPAELFGFAEIVGAAPTPWPPGVALRQRRPGDVDALLDLFGQADFQRNASTLDPFERPDDARALLDRTGPGVFEMVAVLGPSRLLPTCSDQEKASEETWRAVQGECAFVSDASADRVIGFAGLYAFAGRQRHVGCCTLAVHQHFQKRGVGTALLQGLLRSAYDYVGLERVQLTVFTDNTRAISLYRRAGFRTEGLLRSFARREDGLVDALLLAHHASCDEHKTRTPRRDARRGSELG